MSQSSSIQGSDSLKKTMDKLDPKLTSVFIPWSLRHPKHLRTYLKLSRAYIKSKEKRVMERSNGLMVPPVLILSITSRCNLRCAGCYASAAGTVNNEAYSLKSSLDIEQWHSIIKEASDLGIFGFVIAGGEPFLYPHILDLCEEFKDRLFLILTNGTAIKESDFKRLKRLSNTVIIVSIEGDNELTDSRRGDGVYRKSMTALTKLTNLGVLTGVSVTITRMNFRYWMDPSNIDELINQGVRIGTFIEYIPTTPGTEIHDLCNESASENDHALMLTTREREEFRARMLEYRDTKQIYIVHSPGDEEYFGGCVSAGRGFAHVTPRGDLTPCPVSNVATHNLTTSNLREGLASPLFSEIRENEHLLETEGMPCALFAHPNEVDALARTVGAYRTG